MLDKLQEVEININLRPWREVWMREPVNRKALAFIIKCIATF
jgi:hypothetical protein